MHTKFLRMATQAGFDANDFQDTKMHQKLNSFAEMLVRHTVPMALENCLAFSITHRSLEEYICEDLGIGTLEDKT